MEQKPYNPNPSLQLIEAFQRVNTAYAALSVMCRLGREMYDPFGTLRANRDLENFGNVIQQITEYADKAFEQGLDALHRNDLVGVQSAAQSAQNLKQEADNTLRKMFEVYMTLVWNTKEGYRALKNERGEVLRWYGESQFFYGLPREDEDDLPF